MKFLEIGLFFSIWILQYRKRLGGEAFQKAWKSISFTRSLENGRRVNSKSRNLVIARVKRTFIVKF